MSRCQADALRRHQVHERIVLRRQVLVHRVHHVFIGLRPRDLQHARMAIENLLGLRAETSRDDDLAVLLERLADRVERFVDGGIDEAAGVHDDDVRGIVRRRHLVTLGAQLRDDAFGIHERFGAPEADKPDFWLAAAHEGAQWYTRPDARATRGGHMQTGAVEARRSGFWSRYFPAFSLTLVRDFRRSPFQHTQTTGCMRRSSWLL